MIILIIITLVLTTALIVYPALIAAGKSDRKQKGTRNGTHNGRKL